MEHGFYHPERGYWQTNSKPVGPWEIIVTPAEYERDGHGDLILDEWGDAIVSVPAVTRMTDDIMETYPKGTIEVPIKPGADYEWQNGEWVYVQPPPEPPPPLTFLQLIIGLVAEGWISEAEGEAWLDGTPPPQVDALISQLPAEERFPARARAKRFTIAERDDPLVNGLGQIEGKTPEDLDAFFHQYSQI